MDFQQLDQMQYMYKNGQISEEAYKSKQKPKTAFKKLMIAAMLVESASGGDYFSQKMEEFDFDEYIRKNNGNNAVDNYWVRFEDFGARCFEDFL